MTQPRRGTWPCEPLAWPVPRSSLRSCWARWNPRWQAWDLEENSRTDVSQEGSSRRKRAIDSVQQNSIIGLDVDIMVAAAPGDTNHSIPAIVDEAVQTYLTVSQLYILYYISYILSWMSRPKQKTVRPHWRTRWVPSLRLTPLAISKTWSLLQFPHVSWSNIWISEGRLELHSLGAA